MSGSSGDFSLGGMNVRGMTRLQQSFQNATKALHDRLLGIVTEEVQEIADLARARMGELFKDPARMQASVDTLVQEGGTFIYGAIFASGLPYLQIQEYGGAVMTPDIFPTSASALHFFSDTSAGFTASRAFAASDEIFTRGTRAHLTVLPERSFMRYALAQRASAIRERFAQAAIDSIDI